MSYIWHTSFFYYTYKCVALAAYKNTDTSLSTSIQRQTIFTDRSEFLSLIQKQVIAQKENKVSNTGLSGSGMNSLHNVADGQN